MPKPTPLLRSLGAAFSYATARSTGISPKRLRARDLDRPYRGARLRPWTDPNPDDDSPGARDRRMRRKLLRNVAGYETVRRPHVFYAGRTALGILALPFGGDPDAPLTVAVITPAQRPRMIGVTSTRLSANLATVTEYDGLPVTSPASTWAMLAGELSERELTILADAIVRIPRGTGGAPQPERQLATPAQLRAAALAPYRRHRAKLLRALERARVGSMSVLETEYRPAAEDAGLPEPDLDVEIRDARGRLIGIGDLVHREEGVVVEVEGDQHRTSRAQWDRDLEKHAAYNAAGWKVVRVSARHIRGSRRAVEMVGAALAGRAP